MKARKNRQSWDRKRMGEREGETKGGSGEGATLDAQV